MKIFRRHFLVVLTLFLVVLLSQSNLLKMYFWHDDYTTLYQIQQGKLMWFPYHFTSFLTKISLPIFGLEPKNYFAVGIFLYFTASSLLYSLIYLFLKNKKLAFLTAVVFAVGYIGQDEMKMFLGTGFGTILGMNALLFSFIALFIYHQNKKLRWLLISFLAFFGALEASPYRYGGFVFAIVLADWIFSFKKEKISSIIPRTICFFLIFILQYRIHPTQIILRYEASGSPSVSFELKSILSAMGSFWNTLFPWTYYLESIDRLRNIDKNLLFWVLYTPTIVFSVIIFFLLGLLRRKNLSFKVLAINFGLFIALSGFCILFIRSLNYTRDDYVQFGNGIVFLILLIFVFLMRLPAFPRLALFSIVLTLGGLSIYALVPQVQPFLESSHRYLLPVSFTPALLSLFFLPKEIFSKLLNFKKVIAWLIFSLPVVFLILSHFEAGFRTQQKFAQNYSLHARNIYTGLKKNIPSVSEKTLIYIEAVNKDLMYSLADAVRVGALKPAGAFAAHYMTNQENFVLPDSPRDIPSLVKKENLSSDNIFTFIYDGLELKDTSQETRRLLISDEKKFLGPTVWSLQFNESIIEKTIDYLSVKTFLFERGGVSLGIYPVLNFIPNGKILTLIPLKITVYLSAKLNGNINPYYYHLLKTKPVASKEHWGSVLDWQIKQCRTNKDLKEFECITSIDLLRNLLEEKKDGKIRFSWYYSSNGLVDETAVELKIPLDNAWHKYVFVIPGGGEYLKELSLDYSDFPGEIKIGSMVLEYEK